MEEANRSGSGFAPDGMYGVLKCDSRSVVIDMVGIGINIWVGSAGGCADWALC